MKILNLIFLSQLFLSSSILSNNNQFYIKEPDNWIEKISYDVSKNLTYQETQVGGIYLLVDFQSNTQKCEQYKHFIIKINNEVGISDFSDIWINYDPSYQKLFFHDLKIYRDNNVYNRLNKKDFKVIQNETDLDKKIYNGTYSAGTFIEDVKAGDVIEFSYTIAGENPLFKDLHFENVYMQYGIPIKKMLFSLKYSKQQNINYKLLNTKLEPTKSEDSEFFTLKWEQTDISEMIANSELPSWYTPYPAIQISSFKNWEEMISWGRQLFPEVIIEGTPLEKEIKSRIDSLSGIDNKINSIISFVQDEIRYVGIEADENSYRPRNPIQVYEKRYGDCKDKSYLLSVLLKNIGVESYLAYVNTTLKYKISGYLPSPTLFNHVIVAFKMRGKFYFVDPTISGQKGDYRTMFSGNYGKALILDSDHPTLADIKIISNEKVVIHEMYDIVDTVSPAKYYVNSSYFGGEADKMRSLFKNNSIKELENSYVNFYSSFYPKMNFTKELQYSDYDAINSFETTENYEISSFWFFDNSPEINDYRSFIIAKNLKNYISVPSEKNRKMPFALYHPIEIQNTIKFINAKEIAIKDNSGEIINSNFQFSYYIKQFDKRTLSFEYYYKSLKDHVDTSEMQKYFADLKKIDDLTYYEFTWGKNTQEGPKVNWLFIVLFTIMIIILYFIASNLYKRDIEIELIDTPLQIGGWLILVAIGMFITPILIVYQIIKIGYFDFASWNFISSSKSAGFDIVWSVVFMFELFFNCLILVYSIFLIVLLLKRRTIFPMHFIVFRLLVLLLLILDYIMVSQIKSVYFVNPPNGTYNLIKTIIATVIWVPYMYYSYRVKDTFVYKYKKENEVPFDNRFETN